MSARSWLLVWLCALLALVAVGCRSPEPSGPAEAPAAQQEVADDEVLTIAIAGMVTPKSGLDYYLGLSEYVGRKVGRPVRLIHKSDYTTVNEMLEDGRVDFAYVCSGPYAIGHDTFGLRLVAAPVVNGKPAYYSYLIAPKDSTAASWSDLKGKVFAFTDPASNTGCLVPKYQMAQEGLEPETFFKETFYTYGHDNSIDAVAKGEADAASVDSLIYDFLAAKDPEAVSNTRIISTSEEFAIPPVVAGPDVDPALFEQVKSAFLGASDDPEGKAFLDKMAIERFVEIEDSAYDSIRRMDEQLAE